jgi:hypothetical protein
MNTIAIGMSAAGLVVVMGTWIAYLSTIPRGIVPARPLGSIIFQCVGIGLAISAVISAIGGGGTAGIGVIAPAVMALMMGSAFFWLLSIRKTPVGDLKVKVGDRLLNFEAMTAEGTRFHSNDLAGKRTLLKFFRGGW